MNGFTKTGIIEIPLIVQIPEGVSVAGGNSQDREALAELKELVQTLRDLLSTTNVKVFWAEDELAAELNMPVLSLKRLRLAGKIDAKCVSRKYFYTKKHVEDYLNSK